MVCPKCGSENVLVTTEQTSAKTKGKNMGCLWSLGRMCLIVCTCGLWLLVGKKVEQVKLNMLIKQLVFVKIVAING